MINITEHADYNLEKHHKLTYAISALSGKNRIILTMYYFESKSLTEIADIFDITVKEIHNIIETILTKLKEVSE